MKKFIAIVVFICSVMVSSTGSAGADWVWVDSNEKRTNYVDNNSIRRDYNYSGYVFRAFIKTVYSDAGRNSAIEDWRTTFGEPLPRGIYNLSHSINLSYFKWTDGMKYVGILNSIYYASDGNTIPEMGFSKDTIKWTIIPPDSIGEWIFDVIRARVPN